MPNELITFYPADGSPPPTVTTTATGTYSKSLVGPKQYVAVVEDCYCTPNPLNVPSGTLRVNLAKTATPYP